LRKYTPYGPSALNIPDATFQQTDMDSTIARKPSQETNENATPALNDDPVHVNNSPKCSKYSKLLKVFDVFKVSERFKVSEVFSVEHIQCSSV